MRRTVVTLLMCLAVALPPAAQDAGEFSLTGHADFAIEVDGDHRGREITATHTRNRRIFFDDFLRNTSELSNGVIAQ